MAVRTALSFLLLATVSGAEPAPQVQRIEITDVGIYKVETSGTTVPAPNDPAGHVSIMTSAELLRKTTTVPATLGTRFGFLYTLIGKPNGAVISLKFVDRFPPPGLRNPAAGKTQLRGEYSLQKDMGSKNYKDYGFDEDWELVPGTWTFEIWQDDRKLAEQSFTVVKP
jgi:hypothetical protein